MYYVPPFYASDTLTEGLLWRNLGEVQTIPGPGKGENQ